MDQRLCQRCHSIFEDPEHLRVAGQIYSRVYNCTHHASFQSLRDAAKYNCPICVIILPLYSSSLGQPSKTNTDCITSTIIYRPTTFDEPLHVQFRFSNISLYFEGCRGDKAENLAWKACQVTPVTQLKKMRKRVEECVSTHSLSNAPQFSQFRYPTRLLQVNHDGGLGLRLIETTSVSTIQGPYNVLSYRWGTCQSVKLLKSNVLDFCDRINLSSLPRTLADAVKMTREMGVSYLWIDALCIIQDSVEDWASESRSMASVYGNAHCSLAASHNIDSNGGLDPCVSGSAQGGPISVRLPSDDDRDDHYTSFQLFERDSDFWESRVDRAPINSRGWVVQERVLAPRTIHFTFDQPMFQCREERYSTTRGPLCVQYTVPLLAPYLQYSASPSYNNDISLSGSPHFATFWRTLVSYYTEKKLTFERDRPVAIAGIAQALKQRYLYSGTQYIAGLWSSGLLRWLLWRSSRPVHPGVRTIPSWSWFAGNGKIRWEEEVIFNEKFPNTNAHAEVEGIRVITTDGTSFGEVTEAVLEMRVVIFQVEVKPLDSWDKATSMISDMSLGEDTKLGKWIKQGKFKGAF